MGTIKIKLLYIYLTSFREKDLGLGSYFFMLSKHTQSV